MLESILEIDRQVFIFVNSGLSNPIFDFVLPWLRNKFFWIPLYAAVAILLWKHETIKFWPSVIALVLAIILADQISASVLKPLFERARPCHAQQVIEQLNLLVGCGAGKSFPSSHATNHFAIGALFGFILPGNKKWILTTALVWAAAISFAQVYVGVHFPLDILGGSILGLGIAMLIFMVFRKFVKDFPQA